MMSCDATAEYHQWYNNIDTVRKMMLENGGALCPSCCTPFDKGKHRKLIDTCGHEICYLCINSDHCPLCVYNAKQAQSQLYYNSKQDAGVSRPRLKTNGHFTTYMQTRERTSPERPAPIGVLPPKAPQGLNRSYIAYSPRLSRAQRIQKQPKWSSIHSSDSQAAFSDDEIQSNSKDDRDQDLCMRLGLLLGDRMALSGRKMRASMRGSQDSSYPSISSLASSEANTTNTSPLSTLTDSSDVDPLSRMGSLRVPSRDPSSDSVVSLMSNSTGNSSCSSPIGTRFQRHIPTRTSDSFIQYARRNLTRRQFHHKSQESDLNLSVLGKRNNPSKLLKRTLKLLNFEVPQSEPDPLFLGRQWLFKEIEQEFLVDPKGKNVVAIVGCPGSGKTAIVSQLVEYSSFRIKREDNIYQDIQSLDGSDYNMSNSSSSDSGLYQSISTLHHGVIRSLGSRLVAYHLCQADNHVTCLVPEFVHSMAAHLCRAPQLTGYRDLVARESSLQEQLSMAQCIADPHSAFVRGILEPLHSLRRLNKIPNTTCLMVVDGLNEAEFHRPDYGDTVASFLCRHIEAFPSWLKLIVTVRSSFVDVIKPLPSRYISLDKLSANENLHKDLCSYIMHRINTSSSIRANITVNNSKVEGSSSSKFAAHLANLSKGCVLYVRLTLDLIEKGHLVVKSSSYRVLPVSLSEVYTLSFNLRFTTIKSYERVTPILQLCLATLYPLSLQEIFHTFNARFLTDFVDWDDFMGRIDCLITNHFVVTRQDGTVMFAHPSMREWLLRREENESTKFLCDVRVGHSMIAFRMSRGEKQLNADETMELGHHILKAHIYKNVPKDSLPCHPRDLQAFWVNVASKCIESSIGSYRNVYNPNVKVSRLLLLAGASPHYIVQSLGNTPILALAAQHGFTDMVSLLLEFGADINSASSSGTAALAMACKEGHSDVVRLLISKGAKVNQMDKEGKCPAVHAASSGHSEALMLVLQCDWPPEEEGGLSLTESAQRSLVAAASKGYANICEFLLDMSEVSANDIDDLTGDSPLTAASAAGHPQTINALLRRGASVVFANQKREAPLLCAVAEGHWEAAEGLMFHGAPLEQEDSRGRTPLMLAAMGGHPVLELLLSKGASSEVCDKEGLTALCWACLKGHYQTVQCLINHGSDINHSDRNGRTPLDFAAFNGDPDVVQLLLDSGAVMEHVDVTGTRPLDRAISCKNTAAVIRFLHKGAKLGSQTWAMAEGNPEIVLLLLTKLLEDATVLCKRAKLKESVHRYQYALKKFPSDLLIAHDPQFQQLKCQLYLGLSRCKRKMNEPKSALEAADQAMLLKPKAYECYYARARANEMLGMYDSALADIMEALRLSPQSQDVKKVLMRLKEQISDAARSSEKLCDTSNDCGYVGFSGMELESTDNFGSTETIDQLCNMTLNLVADLTQLKDRMQDSGCESIH